MARREYPESPIVGVGAVILHESRVVLVRRGKEPLKGEWSIPGGGVELGETLEAAVRREILEETGLLVETKGIVEVLDRIVLDKGRVRYHYVLVDFLCHVNGGELMAGDDVDEARWVSREELSLQGSYALNAGTMAVIDKAIAMQVGTGP